MTWTSDLQEYAAGIKPRTNAAVRDGAELVVAAAKARVPVDSGALKAAIHIEDAGRGDVSVVAGNNDAFYGHIVEHGSVHVGARPFLVPALEENAVAIVSIVRKAL